LAPIVVVVVEAVVVVLAQRVAPEQQANQAILEMVALAGTVQQQLSKVPH